MAEWLCRGLQILVQRFESGPGRQLYQLVRLERPNQLIASIKFGATFGATSRVVRAHNPLDSVGPIWKRTLYPVDASGAAARLAQSLAQRRLASFFDGPS